MSTKQERIQAFADFEAGRITAAEMRAVLNVGDAARSLAIRVSPPDKTTGVSKGAVCVYGLARFPVTLYPTQWAKVAENMQAILDFIADNKARLSFNKGDNS